ncbi:serine/threonine-protein kinase [Nonomuraea sp. NPDC050790]|uniref:serine/threonine-protein kinase n=1 Tax=Nonomuraea sp. NPDC050790 TaxID=3364371 RepID=UPI0037BBFAD4
MSRLAELRTGDPRRLGSYLLAGRLGQGGQGVVFLGTTPAGAQVAIKLLHASVAADPAVRRRFLGEVEAVRRVAPFCTAQVLDAALEDDRPYIVSEYVDGVSLRDHVVAKGPRAGGSLDRLAIGTATALSAIHRAGVVHRDFKPDNVLLSLDGPRVIDFGVSRLMDGAATTNRIPVGTPAYLAPERIEGESAGPPADMYAWALTLAYTANGRHAYRADTYQEILARIMYGRPDLGTLTGRLREIVEACLARVPGERPGAEEVLGSLLGHGGLDARDALTSGAMAAVDATDPRLGVPEGNVSAGDGSDTRPFGPDDSAPTNPGPATPPPSDTLSTPAPGTGHPANGLPAGSAPGGILAGGGNARAGAADGLVAAAPGGGPGAGEGPAAASGSGGAGEGLAAASASGGAGEGLAAAPGSGGAGEGGVSASASGGAGGETATGGGATAGGASLPGGGSAAVPGGGRVGRWQVAVAVVGVLAGVAGFGLWLRGAQSPGLAGTWTGSADHPSAGRVFPVEIRLAGEGGSAMRWGADLHCSGRLSETSSAMVFTLDEVRGQECYPGTLRMFPSGGDMDQAVIRVTRSGDTDVTYSGKVSRPS